jgi:hypothetical protein
MLVAKHPSKKPSSRDSQTKALFLASLVKASDVFSSWGHSDRILISGKSEAKVTKFVIITIKKS